MKKFIIALLFLAVAFAACGQDNIYRDSATALWDAPASPILLAGEAWEYDVYLSAVSLGDPSTLLIADYLFMGRSATETLVMDMNSVPRTPYYFVVHAVLIRADGIESPREQGDSLNNADPTLHPLGLIYYPEGGTEGKPGNLQDAGM